MINLEKKTREEIKKTIVKTIKSITKKRSPAEVFHDFVRMSAIAYHNAVNIDQELENDYLRTISKYGEKEREGINNLLNMVIWSMHKKRRDVLGEIYMEMNLGNEEGGQFFSPYATGEITSGIMFNQNLKNMETITIKESSCGSGGMIIAYIDTLFKNGINFQEKLYVVASDADIKAVYMTYLQLSIIGVKAVVSHKDALKDDVWQTLETPMMQLKRNHRQ